MTKVKFTYALKRFFPGLEELETSKTSIKEILDEIELLHPGMKGYIVDEQGVMRKHVNIYINETLIKDRIRLTDKVAPDNEVFIMQALSGG